jgi:hypothetical protein
MEINYNWEIVQLDAINEFEGLSNIVYDVHWELIGSTTSDEVEYSESAIGVARVLGEELDTESFIPAEQLTKEIVVSWIIPVITEERIDIIKANLQKLIEDKINPSTSIIEL